MKVVRIHKSCSTLPIYNFYKCSLYSDFRFMIRDYDEYDDNVNIKYKKDTKEFKDVFNILQKEYMFLNEDKRSLTMKKEEFRLLHLITRYDISYKILKLFSETLAVEVLDLLNEFGIKYDAKDPSEQQIKAIESQLKVLKNKINIAKINFENKYGTKSENISADEFMINLDKEALDLETYLELGYRLDVREITIERWVNLKKMAKNKTKSIESASLKRK